MIGIYFYPKEENENENREKNEINLSKRRKFLEKQAELHKM